MSLKKAFEISNFTKNQIISWKKTNTGFAFAVSTKTKIVVYTFFQENFFLWWTINGCQMMKKSLSVIDFLKDIYLHSSKLMNIYVQKFFKIDYDLYLYFFRPFKMKYILYIEETKLYNYVLENLYLLCLTSPYTCWLHVLEISIKRLSVNGWVSRKINFFTKESIKNICKLKKNINIYLLHTLEKFWLYFNEKNI